MATTEDRRETDSGIEIKPVYTEADAERELELPGEFPFTRGPCPDMYRGRPWTIRQYAGFGSAEETHARFRYLQERGQTGLPVAFDVPTQRGYDSDDIREAGSTAVQELAFTLANGIAYAEAAVAAGLSPDDFGERLSFFFNAHNHFFQEIAKFRAARRLWARIMRDRFGATNPRAQAGRSRSTRMRSTRRSRYRRSAPRRSRCGRSRSLRTRPGGRTPPTRSGV